MTLEANAADNAIGSHILVILKRVGPEPWTICLPMGIGPMTVWIIWLCNLLNKGGMRPCIFRTMHPLKASWRYNDDNIYFHVDVFGGCG